MKTVVIIPARLRSSRLPGKVLLDLDGKPIVRWVYERARQAQGVHEVYIATDSAEVERVCRQFTENVIMTSDTHQSGTDRIAEAASDLDAEVVINVQGDEPLISPEVISKLAGEFQDESLQMGSVMTLIDKAEDVINPNVVKVVTDSRSNALYFSRSPIPYPREAVAELHRGHMPKGIRYYKHLGIYGYRKDFLLQYYRLAVSPLEETEKLEQLRALQNGYCIRMIETDYNSVGIDTKADLEQVRALVKKENA
ncbi:MAG: 3-deoxy-manno-octulosonate cytidylyltransferase [Cytophagales bacterium]|nr:3-deoxy-manno-octulosonate cytidylyltransferase [Cytophagales bacterium]